MPILSLEYDIDFSLVGIHSVERGYRLAFLLNKFAKTYLTKTKEKSELEKFEYEDEHNFVKFYLIKNKYSSNRKRKSISLFQDEIETIRYVIPERKKIDYFLKIDDCDNLLLEKILEKIKKIKEVQTSYIIDVNTLKSKNNLIF